MQTSVDVSMSKLPYLLHHLKWQMDKTDVAWAVKKKSDTDQSAETFALKTGLYPY